MVNQACGARRKAMLMFVGSLAGMHAAQAQLADEAAASAELATIPVQPSEPAPEDIEGRAQPADQLEEVIVTSTKRTKALRDIPASITAMAGDDLERRGAQGAEDIVKLVPGVNITAAGDSAARVTIRGISAEAGTNPTTGVLFGDVSFTDAYLPRVTLDPNPFDLQSVEVLKGPQGTLFGAGALNGAIRYVPEPPNFSERQLKYFLQYTQLSEGGGAPIYGAAVNLPFGADDDLALRLVGFERRSPGYIDDLQSGKKDVNEFDQSGLRGILGWRPGDAWKLTLTYAQQQGDLADTAVADNPDGQLSHDNRPRPSPSHTDYDLLDLCIRYDFGAAEAVSQSAYIRKRAHNFFDASSRLPGNGQLPLFAQADDSHSETYSQELRLVSHDAADDRWQWVAGAFGSRQNVDYDLRTPVGALELPVAAQIALLDQLLPGIGGLIGSDGEPSLATISTAVTVDELALFGELTRRFGRDWELTVGGRLYRTSSGGTAHQSGALLLASTGELDHVVQGTVKGQGFNPKLSLLWHASDAVLAYAAVSRGFRVGGVQPGYTTALSQQQAPDFFKSDTIWNYEAGLRSEWLQRTLRFDLTTFYEQWRNPQVLQVDSSAFSSYFDNAGGVRSQGVETSLQYLFPLHGLSLNAAVAYTDTQTTKPFTTSDGSVAEPGSAWPFAPHWQTATTLSYQRGFDTWMAGASVTHLYLGTASSDLAQQLDVFGYQQWNLQASFTSTTLAWLPELTFNIDNLLDERGVSHTYVGNTYTDVTYIRPRAYILRLGGRF
jgi:iron complex outermembrane receptor protein